MVWLRMFFALVQVPWVPKAHALRDTIEGNLLVLMDKAGLRAVRRASVAGDPFLH